MSGIDVPPLIPPQAPSRGRRVVATICSLITACCAALFLLTIAFMIAQSVAGVYDSPILGVAVLMFTLPPAIICTLIAVILVGFRRCRLAWISLSTFVLPFALTLIAILWESVSKMFR